MYTMSYQDQVIKRNGQREVFSFDKILKRVTVLGNDEKTGKVHLQINYTSLVQKIIDRLYDGISTKEIDELTAQQCASLITTHPDYGRLASRILVSNQKYLVFYKQNGSLHHQLCISQNPFHLISFPQKYLNC